MRFTILFADFVVVASIVDGKDMVSNGSLQLPAKKKFYQMINVLTEIKVLNFLKVGLPKKSSNNKANEIPFPTIGI